MQLIEELKWRGLFQDEINGAAEYLVKNPGARAYIGFDPTASSLGIGNLVQVILLKHLQRFGYQPVVLLGGATGMIGDPSGKSTERNLIDEQTVFDNIHAFKNQLEKFFSFGSEKKDAVLVNNYDWYKEMHLLHFLRDVGKHLTVNYMMAKDSVKSRMETGISYTEFSYQLLQANDFLHLSENFDCNFQMGGSDQWGNIVSGIELIRRVTGRQAFGITSPLVTKTDGSKFGKSEEGNIFISSEKTSVYKFYQFWLNLSDEDAEKMIKIFTFLERSVIEELIAEHKQAPHLRLLQKELAKEVTIWVHSDEELQQVIKASEILFGKSTGDALNTLSDKMIKEIFEGVPFYEVDKAVLDNKALTLNELLTEHTDVYESKGALKRDIKNNALSLNKEKVKNPELPLSDVQLINQQFLLIQKGKKNFHLLAIN